MVWNGERNGSSKSMVFLNGTETKLNGTDLNQIVDFYEILGSDICITV